MSVIGSITPVATNKSNTDTIQLDSHRGLLKGCFTLFRFQDKDTKQFVYICPSLDISGYGETDEKAQAMVKFSLDDYFEQLAKRNFDEIKVELTSLGWRKSFLRNKEYSKDEVDITGELKNLNADETTVQRLQLVA